MRSLNDSNIEVSTQGFEITSSNMSKKLKGKRGKIDLKKKKKRWKISTENWDLLQRN